MNILKKIIDFGKEKSSQNKIIFNDKRLLCKFDKYNKEHLLDIETTNKLLPCGNTCCYECIKCLCKNKRNVKFKCVLCTSDHFIPNFSNLETNFEIIHIYQANFVNLHADLCNNLSSFMNEEENKYSNAENLINFIEEDFEIRIESIKIQIDVLYEKCLNELENVQEKFKIKSFKLNKKLKAIGKSGKIRRSCINILIKQTKSLNTVFSRLSSKDRDLKKIYFRNVGLLVCPYYIDRSSSVDLDKYYESNPRLIHLGNCISHSSSMCDFNDLELLVANNHGKLIFLNSSYNSMGIEVDVRPIMVSSVCSNNNDRIYLLDVWNPQVLIVDRNSGHIIRKFGRMGFSRNEFTNPSSLCYFDRSLYVLDTGNHRIQKFSNDGVYEKLMILKTSNKHRFVENAVNMCVSYDTLIVSDVSYKIYVYSFEGQLRSEVDHQQYGIYSLGLLYNYLFVHGYQGSIVCYDLIEVLTGFKPDVVPEFKRFEEQLNRPSHSITFFNGDLIILLKTNCLAVL